MAEPTGDDADRMICVLGMGYVGLTLAAALSDVGIDVLGVEIRDDVLETLQRCEPHIYEPGLSEKLRRGLSVGSLSFAKRVPAEWPGKTFIITVGTPLDTERRSRMDMVERVSHDVSAMLKPHDLVIMRSTMKLGTTRRVVVPILDRAGVPYDLAVCPERTLEGNALAELRQLPQIVGGMSGSATARAAQLFQVLTPAVVRVSDVETAEMIKLVDNAQRDVMFAYANEIARACDAAGVSAIEVIEAGKAGYPRTNLPIPGPVGGPCLEKDSYIFAEALREAGVNPEMTMAARALNERQPREVAAHLATVLRSVNCTPTTIALLGIAFKGRPVTNDLRGTMAKPVLAALREQFPLATYRGYDAVVAPDEIRAMGMTPCATIGEAFAGASLVVVVNNHPAFAAMPLSEMADCMSRPGLIYDFWNMYRAADLHLPDGVGYMALGSHSRAVLPGTAT